MKRINENTIDISKIVAPTVKKDEEELIPNEGLVPVDDLVKNFLFVHPSQMKSTSVVVQRGGVSLFFPHPPGMKMNFRDLENGSDCTVDFFWNDIVRKEDL